MNFGFILPYGDARTVANLAQTAEEVGWDGFFVWEPVWGIDAWVALTAAAMQTEKIRLGTMLSPISRMRPWKLASETATLDNLSGGRVTLAVGLGAIESGFVSFGEESDLRTRAELMDEGLEILTGLWQGQPFRYEGKHYTIKECDFFPPPPPTQQPRIPIWVAGAWPRPKSMRRVLKYDGLLPVIKRKEGGKPDVSPAHLTEMKAYVDEKRLLDTPFDFVVEGTTSGTNSAEDATTIREWVDAGATWWLESMWNAVDDVTAVRRRIEQGPPIL